MGVSEGKSEYERNTDSEAWKNGVGSAGSDWGDGVSSAGSDWSQGADGDSYASGIEADPDTDGSVPDSVKTDYESGVQQSTQDFENAGSDSENQSNYENSATDENASEYSQNVDGDEWESGYTDLSSWGE